MHVLQVPPHVAYPPFEGFFLGLDALLVRTLGAEDCVSGSPEWLQRGVHQVTAQLINQLHICHVRVCNGRWRRRYLLEYTRSRRWGWRGKGGLVLLRVGG